MTRVPLPGRPFVFVGAGEFGRDCLTVVEAHLDDGADLDFRGFVDDGLEPGAARVGAWPVLGGTNWLTEQGGAVAAICTIGSHPARRRVIERLEAAGVPFTTLVHPRAEFGRTVEVGTGVVVMANVSATIDVRIEDHVGINPGCTIAHDVVIGRFSYLSPGVDLAGRAAVGQEGYLGTGSVVLPRIRVGDRATLGAGAVATRDVPAGETRVGVPARPIRRSDDPSSEPTSR